MFDYQSEPRGFSPALFLVQLFTAPLGSLISGGLATAMVEAICKRETVTFLPTSPFQPRRCMFRSPDQLSRVDVGSGYLPFASPFSGSCTTAACSIVPCCPTISG